MPVRTTVIGWRHTGGSRQKATPRGERHASVLAIMTDVMRRKKKFLSSFDALKVWG